MTQHDHQTDTQTPTGRPVQANRIITRLNAKLDEKANQIRDQIRAADDVEVYYQALTDELDNALAMRVHIIDQVIAENRILRGRLGIGEGEPIKLTEAEAAEATEAGAAVVDDAAANGGKPADQPPPDVGH